MNNRSPLRRSLFALVLLLVTSALGVVGFRFIEGYTWIDAVYVTANTMSTVGFGTIGDLSEYGKIFATSLIFISAGTFLYAITTLTSFVVEGEVRQVLTRYQVNKKIAKLKNHVIICGMGRNGQEAAHEFLRQKQLFVVIESDENVIEQVQHKHEILFVHGDATLEEVLEEARIKHARGLISALSSDAENVFIALTARGLNPKLKIIARANQESAIPKLKRAGADEVITPTLIGGRKMANLVTRPALMEFIELVSGEGNSHLDLEVIAVTDHPALLGKTLKDLQLRSRTGVVVLGFKRGQRHVELNPPPSEKLTEMDRLFMMGTPKQFEHFRDIFLS